MALYAYEPLLTTDGVRPVPRAVVGFYADTDTEFKSPLEVFTLEGESLGFSPVADKNGYINNAGGYMLPVQYGKSKSGKLPAVPVFSVRSVIEDAKSASDSAATSEAAAVKAAAKADQIPALVTQATANNSTVVAAAAAAVDANPKIAELQAAISGAGLVTNGAFRDGLTSWGNTGAWATESNGITTWARATSGADGALTQTITLPTYLLGRTIRVIAIGWTTSVGSLFTRVTTVAGNTEQSHPLTTGAGQTKTLDVTIPASQGTTPITLHVGRASGNVYMTGIDIEVP